jgi:fatty acid desaturase
MIPLYKYLFFRYYTWYLREWGPRNGPEWNAMFITSAMMGMNISLLGFLIDIAGYEFYMAGGTPKTELTALIAILYLFNYFRFLHKRKYTALSERFADEPKNEKRRNTILLWLYIFFSFFAIGFCYFNVHHLIP